MSLKKQITISPNLLKSGGGSIKNKSKEKNKEKVKLNRPSKLKTEFLKRIKTHKQNIKNEKKEDVAFSSDFKESMSYLMDMMKDNTPSSRGRTLKHRKPQEHNTPHVNLGMPMELANENTIQISTPVLKQQSISSPMSFPMSSPMSAPMSAPMSVALQNPIPKPIVTQILPSPEYGILKGGSKPTYRTWLNKTQKNRNSENKVSDHVKTEREEKLNHLKNKFGIFSKPKIEKDNKVKKTKFLTKKKHYTIKRKFKLGKNNTRRKISVLIKNKVLRARVQVERSMLRAKPLHVMKNYLYSHGILKVGNNAPKDLIKQIYEDAILTGDVNNTSKEVLIYNYLNKKDD
jgi:hypothetical protein